ncbi:MAG: capsule assembly Wzi family protein [Flavobacteriaceae bacterium]
MKNQVFGIDYLNANMKRFFVIVLCFFYVPFFAQEISWKARSETLAVVADNLNPFWFYTNSETSFGGHSNFSLLGEVEGEYPISEKAKISGKLGVFYRDNVYNEFQRKESFVRFSNSWLKISAGAFSTVKEDEKLSVSNKNFLFSGNSRPMPGFLIEAEEPFKISKVFSIDWGIGHFFLNDDHRYVQNPWVHYKRLGMYIRFSERHELHLQLQHYAQWAGTSPVYGDLKDDFNAFIDVFTARKSPEIGANGEILNAVGNHMGSYLFDYYFKLTSGTLNFYHEHPFEDGSGTAWKNFPDGIWGTSYKLTSSKFIEKVLYEFIETTDQSGNTSSSGFDSYFRNNIYRSGWVYEGNFIGLPLMLYDPFLEVNEANSPVISNRLQAHHLAFSGIAYKCNWEVRTTFVKNIGNYTKPLPVPLKNWSHMLLVEYPTQNYGTFRFLGGLDTSNLNDTIWGIGLGYRYAIR